MSTSRRQACAALTLTFTMMSLRGGEAQIKPLTDQDRAEIRALSTTYRRALLGCHASILAPDRARAAGRPALTVR